MNSIQQESNTYIVNEFDWYNHTFIVTETQAPTLNTSTSFGLLSYELMWQEYEGEQWDPSPRRMRSANGRPVSICIPNEMDEENERNTRTKIWNLAITMP